MPLPKEVLEAVKVDLDEATSTLADMKDIVSDMRFAGMDTKAQEAKIDDLETAIRQMKVVYERQKAKSS